MQEPKEQAYDKIAKAKFAIERTGTYPDATHTRWPGPASVAQHEPNLTVTPDAPRLRCRSR